MNREALGLKALLRLERKLAMYFESFEALLAMGGHGHYVWPAYGIAIAVLLWNQLVVKVSKKALLDQWKMTSERQQIIEENKDQALCTLKGNNVCRSSCLA